MDDDIDAEIARELELLPDDLPDSKSDTSSEGLHRENSGDFALEDVTAVPSLAEYLERIKDRSSKFEQVLLDCDDVFISKDIDVVASDSNSSIIAEAEEQGVDILTFRRQVLEKIEQDDLKDKDAYESLMYNSEHLLSIAGDEQALTGDRQTSTDSGEMHTLGVCGSEQPLSSLDEGEIAAIAGHEKTLTTSWDGEALLISSVEQTLGKEKTLASSESEATADSAFLTDVQGKKEHEQLPLSETHQENNGCVHELDQYKDMFDARVNKPSDNSLEDTEGTPGIDDADSRGHSTDEGLALVPVAGNSNDMDEPLLALEQDSLQSLNDATSGNNTVAVVDEVKVLEQQFLRQMWEFDKAQTASIAERMNELKEVSREEEKLVKKIESLREEKRQMIKEEECKIKEQREQQEQQEKVKQERVMKDLECEVKQYEEKIESVQLQIANEKKALDDMITVEKEYQLKRKSAAAVKMQATVRGHLCRKKNAEDVQDLKENIKYTHEKRWHERLKEVEYQKEVEKEEEKKKKEEENKNKNKELVKKKEEEQVMKEKEEEERIQKDEQERLEKEKKKQEQEQKKLEEKQKQEEQRRIDEEKKQKQQEEERVKKEEEKRRKQEEKERKEEEKRKKEEEKQRKAEEKQRQKEEEKRRKLEEKQKKELEKQALKEKQNRISSEANRTNDEETPDMTSSVTSQEQVEQTKENSSFNNCNHSEAPEVEEISTGDKDNCLEQKDVPVVDLAENAKQSNHMERLQSEVVPVSDLISVQAGGSVNSIKESVQPAEQLITESAAVAPNTEATLNSTNPPMNQPPTSVPQTAIDEVQNPPQVKLVKLPTPPKDPKPVHQSFERKISVHARTPPEMSTSSSKHPSVRPVATPEKPTERLWGQNLPPSLDDKRLSWIKQCVYFSKILHDSHSHSQVKSKRPLHRPASGKRFPALEESLILKQAGVHQLKHVQALQIQDQPAFNLSVFSNCLTLKVLMINRCSLATTAGLDDCKALQYLDLSNNSLEDASFKDLPELQHVDLSHNNIRTFYGLEKCSKVSVLDLSYNNVTRVSGLNSIPQLHNLNLSHNQITSSHAVSECPQLQVLNLSDNALSAVEGLQKMALLRVLDVSNNSLMQVPNLTNNVLLQKLFLQHNNISMTTLLSTLWLPMLQELNLSSNAISFMDKMENLFLLSQLHIQQNQIMDMDCVQDAFQSLRCLELLEMTGNYLCQHKDFEKFMKHTLPYLSQLNGARIEPFFPASCQRTEYEQLCLSQAKQLEELDSKHEAAEHSCLKQLQAPGDVNSSCLLQLASIHRDYVQRSHQMASDYRTTHEYGVTMVSVQKLDIDFDKDLLAEPVPKTNTLKHEAGKLRDLKADAKSKFDAVLPSVDKSKQADCGNLSKDITPRRWEEDGYSFSNGKSEVLKPSIDKQAVPNDTISPAPTPNTLSKQAVSLHSQFHQESRKLADFSKNQFEAALNSGKPRPLMSPRKRSLDSLSRAVHAAVKIQAWWRGIALRLRLGHALDYLKLDDLSPDPDEDMFNIDQELDDFLNHDLMEMERDLISPGIPTLPPTLPPKYPVLNNKPVFNKQQKLPVENGHIQAWLKHQTPPLKTPPDRFNPLQPLPPLTGRTDTPSDYQKTTRSQKRDDLANEWGFKDERTVSLMWNRAKKLKLNAEKRKKISQLDPRQRLALFQKLEKFTRPNVSLPNRKGPPRQDYFRAQERVFTKPVEPDEVPSQHTFQRTYEWVHTQVGHHKVDSSRINNSKDMFLSETNLDRNGLSPPGSGHRLEVLSVGSSSIPSQSQPVRPSAKAQLPPIVRYNSAPSENSIESSSRTLKQSFTQQRTRPARRKQHFK